LVILFLNYVMFFISLVIVILIVFTSSHSGPSVFTGLQPVLFLYLRERTILTAECKHRYEFGYQSAVPPGYMQKVLLLLLESRGVMQCGLSQMTAS
jgi:hypothetical protein